MPSICVCFGTCCHDQHLRNVKCMQILLNPLSPLLCECRVLNISVLNLVILYLCKHAPCGTGAIPLISSLSHLQLYLLVSFTFPCFLSYLIHLFSCFSIPSHFTRIVSLHFQAGCHSRQLNLALFLCVC